MGNANGKPILATDEVGLNHFKLLRVVGKGSFGKVRIVERRDTGSTYALKYIRKDEVVRTESVLNVIRERRMLEHLDHPFLCNLRYSFQDQEYCYLIVDLMTGGDLRFHISRKSFTEDCVRFWIAELACALNYIHSRGIVHRDVKPDNVLLDPQGHVHLADFNVATELKPDSLLHGKSGTLAYLAPEVFLGKGYDQGVDWWGLGVTLFECLYNKRPFSGGSSHTLAQAVVYAPLSVPFTDPPLTPMCTSALTALLSRPVDSRLGATPELPFFSHPFFSCYSPTELEARQITPHFVPDLHCANFDATYDLEELLLEEAPLEARRRTHKPRQELKDNATDAERRVEAMLRLMEGDFEPFDYNRPKAALREAGFTTSPFPPTPMDSINSKESLVSPSGEMVADPLAAFRAPQMTSSGQAPRRKLPPRSVPDSVDITTHPRVFPSASQTHTPIGSQSDTSSFTNPEPGRNPLMSKFRLSRRSSKDKVGSTTSSRSMGSVNSIGSHMSVSPPPSAISGQEPIGRKAQKSKDRSGGKKQRGKSPALSDGENGVLGKEGARVIVK